MSLHSTRNHKERLRDVLGMRRGVGGSVAANSRVKAVRCCEIRLLKYEHPPCTTNESREIALFFVGDSADSNGCPY